MQNMLVPITNYFYKYVFTNRNLKKKIRINVFSAVQYLGASVSLR